MNALKLAIVMAIALACTGCTSDKVIFVTSTSFGINLDTTPGTVSLAYDRTEGYAAPTYQSGALPPVLASIETDGTAISPEIRQLYATGAAAIIAAGGTATGPTALSNRNGRTAFIGTTTTLGLKVAFTTGAPESLNLGFKRKEFSYIPLGCQAAVAGQACSAASVDLYPSVIASYDTTIAVPSPSGTKLRTRQFVATGQAAEKLAPTVSPAFKALAKESVSFKAGQTEAAAHLYRVETVVAYLAPATTFDAKLKALVQTANAAAPGSIDPAISSAQTPAALRRMIGSDVDAAKRLAAAIPQGTTN